MSPPVICVIRKKKQKTICGKMLSAQVFINIIIPT